MGLPGGRLDDQPDSFRLLLAAQSQDGGHPNGKERQGSIDQHIPELGTLGDISLYQFEDAGMLQITFAPSRGEGSYDAARVLLEELTAFKRGGLTEAAIRPLAGQLLRAERLSAERLPDRAERLAESVLFGGLRYYWQLPEIYSRLRPADITRTAQRYLVADNLRLVILLQSCHSVAGGAQPAAY